MTIFLDENLSEFVAEALNSLNKGYFTGITVVSTKLSIGIGKPDEIIIPHIGKIGGILITRDLGISRTQTQYQLCKENNVTVLFIKLPKNQNRHWDLVKLLIKHWEECIKICHSGVPPFGYSIRPNHIEKLKV